jgi:hypothetical protein
LQKKHKTFLTVLFQFGATSIVLFVLYIIFALLDNLGEAGFENYVGFIIFQPLFGTIITLVTVSVCFIVGIPVRFIPRLKAWWLSKPFIPLFGISVGIILLLLSLNPNLMHSVTTTIGGEEEVKQIPNTELAVTGWLCTGFFLLHFYPFSFIAWIMKKIASRKQKRYSSSLND